MLDTWRSPRYTNFHPLRPARTARSISSTVVRSFQPPASLIAAILHTPAVPSLIHTQKSIQYTMQKHCTCLTGCESCDDGQYRTSLKLLSQNISGTHIKLFLCY
jgi:hypothetical protein